MKIEMIEQNRIRVLLTRSELAERNLTTDNLKRNSPYLNEFLFEVMEQIREKTGFNPYSGQVIVEASSDGEGLILIVTKLSPQKKKLSGKDKKRYINARPVLKNACRRKNIYIFDDFEAVCGAVVRLDKRAFEYSSLYRIENKFYYYLEQGTGFEKSNAVLCEYSIRFGKLCSKEYLDEHGDVIFDTYELYEMALNLSKCDKCE